MNKRPKVMVVANGGKSPEDDDAFNRPPIRMKIPLSSTSVLANKVPTSQQEKQGKSESEKRLETDSPSVHAPYCIASSPNKTPSTDIESVERQSSHHNDQTPIDTDLGDSSDIGIKNVSGTTVRSNCQETTNNFVLGAKFNDSISQLGSFEKQPAGISIEQSKLKQSSSFMSSTSVGQINQPMNGYMETVSMSKSRFSNFRPPSSWATGFGTTSSMPFGQPKICNTKRVPLSKPGGTNEYANNSMNKVAIAMSSGQSKTASTGVPNNHVEKGHNKMNPVSNCFRTSGEGSSSMKAPSRIPEQMKTSLPSVYHNFPLNGILSSLSKTFSNEKTGLSPEARNALEAYRLRKRTLADSTPNDDKKLPGELPQMKHNPTPSPAQPSPIVTAQNSALRKTPLPSG